jgi:hypothetical protein
LILLSFVAIGAVPKAAPLPKGVLPSPPAQEPLIRIVTDQETYAPGEPIEITITIENALGISIESALSEQRYLYLYDIDPAGTVTLLYPNRFQPDPRVSAGELHLPGKGYRFVVGYPEGIETLVAVASSIPFPELTAPTKESFRQMDGSPEVFAQGLEMELSNTQWTSAWTQITVYQPKAAIHIASQPAHARILIDGKLRGYTPKDLVLPAGKVTVALEKAGYERFSETILLRDQETFDFEARLQEALSSSPLSGMEVSLGFIGVDLGIDSIGLEIGFTQMIGLSASLRFTGEDPPPLRGLYNLGPELAIDLRLHVAIAERISLLLGAGFAVQNQTIDPGPLAGLSPLAITIEPDIETDVFPSFMLGVELSVGHATVFAGYHLRRGFIFGVELLFAR